MSVAAAAEGILSDVKVVELGNLIRAPFCGKLLADMGAEVIKVEQPGTGDESRQHGPFPGGVAHRERSGLYLFLNTSKLGVTLNPAAPRGRELLFRLLESADVLVLGYSPDQIDEWALDYPSLARSLPRLVVVSITPFGVQGPYRGYRGEAINCAALGGLSVQIGKADREPLAPPLSYTSYMAGIVGAIGCMVALVTRGAKGAGQHVDIAETDAVSTLLTGRHIAEHQFEGTVPRRPYHAVRLYPSGNLRCKDGKVRMNAPQLAQWIRFLEMMGGPSWAENPRYRDRRAMLSDYKAEVDALVEELLIRHSKDEILDLSLKHRVPTAPIKTIEDVVHDGHLDARGFFVRVDQPEVGTLSYPGPPYRLAESPWRIRRPAPLLGEHNRFVYVERLGYDDAALAQLEGEGVI